MARLGHCEPRQLHLLQRRAKGLPQKLLTHPFRFIDHKIQANIHKQPAQKSTLPAKEPGQQFYMDFVSSAPQHRITLNLTLKPTA
jgi:hypothetical protein